MKLTTLNFRTENTKTDFPYDSFSELPIYDQRYVPRWQCPNKIFYRKRGENVLFMSRMKNLTLAGICIYTNPDIHIHDYMQMKIYLTPTVSFQADGIVLWKRIRAKYSYAGIMFDNLSRNTQELITDYAFLFDKSGTESIIFNSKS